MKMQRRATAPKSGGPHRLTNTTNIVQVISRLQLDYGSFVYKSTRTFYLKELDPQTKGRLKTSLRSLQMFFGEKLVEALEASLEHRSKKIAVNMIQNLHPAHSNKVYDCIFKLMYNLCFVRKINKTFWPSN